MDKNLLLFVSLLGLIGFGVALYEQYQENRSYSSVFTEPFNYKRLAGVCLAMFVLALIGYFFIF
ncbi:MAG: hypothetical protein M3Q34_04735 [bacterium]|nr:hypothetical protein [bacterium]